MASVLAHLSCSGVLMFRFHYAYVLCTRCVHFGILVRVLPLGAVLTVVLTRCYGWDSDARCVISAITDFQWFCGPLERGLKVI